MGKEEFKERLMLRHRKTAIEQSNNFTSKIKERHIDYRFIVDNKYIIYRLRVIPHFKTDSFVDAAADTITTDGGFEDFFRNDNGETTMITRIGCKNKREGGRTNVFALLVGMTNAAAGMESVFLR